MHASLGIVSVDRCPQIGQVSSVILVITDESDWRGALPNSYDKLRTTLRSQAVPHPYTIAGLAAAAGVHVETIRYYQHESAQASGAPRLVVSARVGLYSVASRT
jgi:hypothetical protein